MEDQQNVCDDLQSQSIFSSTLIFRNSNRKKRSQSKFGAGQLVKSNQCAATVLSSSQPSSQTNSSTLSVGRSNQTTRKPYKFANSHSSVQENVPTILPSQVASKTITSNLPVRRSNRTTKKPSKFGDSPPCVQDTPATLLSHSSSPHISLTCLNDNNFANTSQTSLLSKCIYLFCIIT